MTSFITLDNDRPDFDTDRFRIQGTLDDGSTFSADDRKGLVDAFEAAKVDYQFIDYAGAVHAFTNPDAGKAGIKGVAYDEKADKRSWRLMEDFFKEAFGPAKK